MNKPTKASDLQKGDRVLTYDIVRTVKRVRTSVVVTTVWWVEGDFTTYHRDQIVEPVRSSDDRFCRNCGSPNHTFCNR
jgi:hypothetical protein